MSRDSIALSSSAEVATFSFLGRLLLMIEHTPPTAAPSVRFPRSHRLRRSETRGLNRARSCIFDARSVPFQTFASHASPSFIHFRRLSIPPSCLRARCKEHFVQTVCLSASPSFLMLRAIRSRNHFRIFIFGANPAISPTRHSAPSSFFSCFGSYSFPNLAPE